MAFSCIYIHMVFGTKRRYPYLVQPIRTKLLAHIRENAHKNTIHIHSINGYEDHIHLLIRLEPAQSIAAVARMIKGESASWLNKENLMEKQFMWAIGYYAASVDGEDKVRLSGYIYSQEARHYNPVKQFLDRSQAD